MLSLYGKVYKNPVINVIMFKTKEIISIILAIILFAFIIWFFEGDTKVIINSFIIASLVILVNVAAKKIAAAYYSAKAEINIWQFQRWGYYQRSQFKSPKPLGLILPFLLVFASAPTGFIKMLTFLQTDISPTIKRAAKRKGDISQRHFEITDWHNGWIVGIGIIVNICLVFLPYLFKTKLMFDIARYSIYYAVWNMIPIGQLDGTKVFFINWKFWIFMWILVFLGIGLLIMI